MTKRTRKKSWKKFLNPTYLSWKDKWIQEQKKEDISRLHRFILTYILFQTDPRYTIHTNIYVQYGAQRYVVCFGARRYYILFAGIWVTFMFLVVWKCEKRRRNWLKSLFLPIKIKKEIWKWEHALWYLWRRRSW